MRKTFFCTLCIITAVISNVFFSWLARYIIIPFYFDSVLTFAVTALCGLLPGLICAVFSNLILWFLYQTSLPFALCHVLTVVCSYLVFRKYKEGPDKNLAHENYLSIEAFLWTGFLSGIVNAFSGNILVSLLYGGRTSPNADSSIQCIYFLVPNLTFATYYAGILTNMTDKIISAVFSFGVYKLGRKRVCKNFSS